MNLPSGAQQGARSESLPSLMATHSAGATGRSGEARAARDLLVDRTEAIFDARRDRRAHVALGHALRHDHDERFGSVLVGPELHDRDRHERDQRERQQDVPPSAQDAPDVLELERPSLHHGITDGIEGSE